MDTIDLAADLNAQDDEGLGWSALADARDPKRVVPGAMLLAGNRAAQAVVRIVAIDDDWQVDFVILPARWTRTDTCWTAPSHDRDHSAWRVGLHRDF